jgi:drug/metabolite transporter (DMT)-like permease
MFRALSSVEIALVVLSALLHAGWSASIKGSRSPLGFNVLQLLPTIAAACVLPIWVDFAEIPPQVWPIVAGTGLCHGLYFYWLSRCLALGELSVVYPIARSAPAFLPLVAIPLLGESISPVGAAGIAVVVAGMVAIQIDGARPWTKRSEAAEAKELVSRVASRRRAASEAPKAPSSLRAPGSGYAWLTLAASVGYSLCDKAAMARLGAAPWSSPIPPAIVYYVMLCNAGALVFAPIALRRIAPRELAALAHTELRPALLASLVSFASYGLILQALRTAPVSYVVATRQTSVLFAIAIGTVRWRERPSRLRLLGALATVTGVALVARSRG